MDRACVPADHKESRLKAPRLHCKEGMVPRIQKWFRLRSIKLPEEGLSAREKADEEGQALSKDIFNYDPARLFWKKMKNRICTLKSTKETPGCRTWKDSLVLRCTNTASL